MFDRIRSVINRVVLCSKTNAKKGGVNADNTTTRSIEEDRSEPRILATSQPADGPRRTNKNGSSMMSVEMKQYATSNRSSPTTLTGNKGGGRLEVLNPLNYDQ